MHNAQGHKKASEPGRGNIVSPTNPEHIAELKRPNPFYETLPAPEVWHRRMPPYFPFGETPYMEAVLSKQIDEDLKRGKLASASVVPPSESTDSSNAGLEGDAEGSRRKSSSQSWLAGLRSSATSAISSMLGSKPQPEKKTYPSAWDLPVATEEEVNMVGELMRTQQRVGSGSVRRRSSGTSRASSQTLMSGGLGALDGAH